MLDYLKQLNPPQTEAVLHRDGPLLIVAGAGAGKTRTITYRIFHLIESGVAPEAILAITFTNKATAEMRHRVEELLSAKYADSSTPIHSQDRTLPFLSTFQDRKSVV